MIIVIRQLKLDSSAELLIVRPCDLPLTSSSRPPPPDPLPSPPTGSHTYADVPVGVQPVTVVTVADVSGGRALTLPVSTDVPAQLTGVHL